ncbi:hypothetical protein [Secundilactobacillus kimchicus]|uniref:hypothetical protein n=1 Tax=Secundilactobacillus kimchicus TaxID=528209 RepID=UPI0006CF811A|nr:hypothetical protein [Secundilactobacillus kimchicus]
MTNSDIIALFALVISILTALYTRFTQLRRDLVNLNWIYQTSYDSDDSGNFYFALNVYNQSSISHSITNVSVESSNNKFISDAYRYPVLVTTRTILKTDPDDSDVHLVYSDYVPMNIDPQHSKQVVLAFSGQLPKDGFCIVLTGTHTQRIHIKKSATPFISLNDLSLIFDRDLGGTLPQLKTVNGKKV